MIYPDFSREVALIERGFSYVAGIDEVGRGAWAGPVVAATVIVPKDVVLADERVSEFGLIRDSKTLSLKQREKLAEFIELNCIWAIGESSNVEIDKSGISEATRLAMERAVNTLTIQPDYLLVDGRESIMSSINQEAIIDGDALSVSIAAASIVAKVFRDRLMTEFDQLYPGYGFVNHVGYGTIKHIQAIRSNGISDIHRLSYKPVGSHQQRKKPVT